MIVNGNDLSSGAWRLRMALENDNTYDSVQAAVELGERMGGFRHEIEKQAARGAGHVALYLFALLAYGQP